MVYSDFHPQYGNMLEIDHGNGLVTRYAHAAKRLARELAVHIADEIASGLSVWDRASRERRAMHAGDILILVRKRDILFEHIIRELKVAGVAVSGADRLKLGEHIAFQDLRALMRFCLQPKDDLALACVA